MKVFRNRRIRLALCILLAVAGLAYGEGAEPMSQAFLNAQGSGGKGPGPIKAFFSLLLGFYRLDLSPVDGPSCSFQPTCSGFAKDAIRKHGLAAGVMMTGDRLIRCNGFDKSDYPRVAPEGHFYDPVP
jgi:putative membrane protein insertion efficiency factor